jgi:hypothetical protein
LKQQQATTSSEEIKKLADLREHNGAGAKDMEVMYHCMDWDSLGFLWTGLFVHAIWRVLASYND